MREEPIDDLISQPWEGQRGDIIGLWRLARLFHALCVQQGYVLLMYSQTPAEGLAAVPPLVRGRVEEVDLTTLPKHEDMPFLKLRLVDEDNTKRIMTLQTFGRFVVSPQEDGAIHVIFYQSDRPKEISALVRLRLLPETPWKISP